MNRLLAAALATPAFAFPALADRHCGPVLDSFYQARQAALDTETSCTAAMPLLTQRVQEAQANARICGCTALTDSIDSLLERLSAADAACDDRRALILDDAADAAIKALVTACH